MPYRIPFKMPSGCDIRHNARRPHFPAPLFPALHIIILCFALAGCGGAARHQPSDTPRALPELFRPLEEETIELLSEAEARALVARLSPRHQGMDSWKEMAFAVRQSLAYASARPAGETAFSSCGLTATWGEIARAQALLHTILHRLDASPALLATTFRWVRLGPDFSFTGYYEPTLPASRTPTAALPHPLYRRPPDLRAGVKYYTRNDIDRKGALRGRGLEFAYVDETNAYFLQVQGSGRLLFPDGQSIHALYAGKNNRPYASLGRIMKERGLLPENGVNMRAIRKYLEEHPDERPGLFDENASYVFFRPEPYGPVGSMGKVLTPWVSVATDRRVLPLGGLTMILTPLPGPDGEHTVPFPALALPQDTGGAIKGHRMDLFCGTGEKAAHIAGYLNIKGAVYLLLPK